MPNVKAKYTSSRGEAKVHIAKDPFFGLMNAWALQPGAAFKEIISESILLLLSFGFPQKWEEMAIAELKDSSQENSKIIENRSKSLKLNLANMQVIYSKNAKTLKIEFIEGAFLIWAVGVLAATVAFSLELFTVYKKRNKVQNIRRRNVKIKFINH